MIFITFYIIGVILTFIIIGYINDSDSKIDTSIPVIWILIWPLWLIIILVYLIVEISNYKPTLKIFKRNKK